MKGIAINLLVAGLLILNVSCAQFNHFTQCKTMYTFGDANYDKQLSVGIHPTKIGPIVADKVPGNFPRKFLEPDGSYGGGRVFCSIREAEQAILDARSKSLLSQEGEWGIYQLSGDWKSYVYELHPNDYRLSKPTTVIKRVK